MIIFIQSIENVRCNNARIEVCDLRGIEACFRDGECIAQDFRLLRMTRRNERTKRKTENDGNPICHQAIALACASGSMST